MRPETWNAIPMPSIVKNVRDRSWNLHQSHTAVRNRTATATRNVVSAPAPHSGPAAARLGVAIRNHPTQRGVGRCLAPRTGFVTSSIRAVIATQSPPRHGPVSYTHLRAHETVLD